jgi:hypothetical protein
MGASAFHFGEYFAARQNCQLDKRIPSIVRHFLKTSVGGDTFGHLDRRRRGREVVLVIGLPGVWLEIDILDPVRKL